MGQHKGCAGLSSWAILIIPTIFLQKLAESFVTESHIRAEAEKQTELGIENIRYRNYHLECTVAT